MIDGKFIITFIICLFGITSFAQSEKLELKNQLLLNDIQSKNWLSDFSKADKITQLKLLKERIALDTNVIFAKLFSYTGLPKEVRFEQEILKGKYVGNKILLVINSYVFSEMREEPTLNRNFKEVSNLIDQIIVDEISILSGVEVTALYGRMGAGGIVLLKTTEKNSVKLVMELSKKLKKIRDRN